MYFIDLASTLQTTPLKLEGAQILEVAFQRVRRHVPGPKVGALHLRGARIVDGGRQTVTVVGNSQVLVREVSLRVVADQNGH